MSSEVLEAKKKKHDATSNKYYSQNRSCNEISRYDIQYETKETPECHLSIMDEQYMKEVTICEEFTEIIALEAEPHNPNYKQHIQETNDFWNKKLSKQGQRNLNNKTIQISLPVTASNLDTKSELSIEIPLENLHFPTEIIRGEEYYSEQESERTPSSFVNNNLNMNNGYQTNQLSIESTDQSQHTSQELWESQQTFSKLNANNSEELLEPEEVEMLLISGQPEEIDELGMEEDEDDLEENEAFNDQNRENNEDKRPRITSMKKLTPEEEKILGTLREVVRKCTVTDPSKRPTASEIMQILSG